MRTIATALGVGLAAVLAAAPAVALGGPSGLATKAIKGARLGISPRGEFVPLLDLREVRIASLDRPVQTQLAALLQSTPAADALPETTSLLAHQTAIRDQRGRGTSAAFAIVAAMEARYKREHNVELDLSEQFLHHIGKSYDLIHPPRGAAENRSSFAGGGGPQWVELLRSYALPPESAAPYLGATQMEQIRRALPAAGALDARDDDSGRVTQAQIDAFEYAPAHFAATGKDDARYGVADYVLLDQAAAREVVTLERLLAGGHEVVLGLDFKAALDARSGAYGFSPRAAGGGHVLLLVGYDRKAQTFLAKNSWGEEAPVQLTYDLVRRSAQGGAVIRAVTPPDQPRNLKQVWTGVWDVHCDGSTGKLIVRRPTRVDNSPTRIGTFLGDDGLARPVNGVFTSDGRGLTYYIDFTGEEPSAPGSLTGQRFDVHFNTPQTDLAAGTSSCSGKPCGVLLSRGPIGAPSSPGFDRQEWVGAWTMSHDGGLGVLSVTAVHLDRDLVATYIPDGGAPLRVEGRLEQASPHVAYLRIYFPDRPHDFTLHYHTRNDGLFSGTAAAGGGRVGVLGRK